MIVSFFQCFSCKGEDCVVSRVSHCRGEDRVVSRVSHCRGEDCIVSRVSHCRGEDRVVSRVSHCRGEDRVISRIFHGGAHTACCHARHYDLQHSCSSSNCGSRIKAARLLKCMLDLSLVLGAAKTAQLLTRKSKTFICCAAWSGQHTRLHSSESAERRVFLPARLSSNDQHEVW